ncbi:MAG TPA: hypothetical protein VFE91_01690 [Nitrososphaerales archaeon]|nr:hypothetical protein [Nitrososphaerales archaeon]
MGSVIETTVKALVDFESELDKVKAEASDNRRKLIKDAADWAAAAKASAMAEAQEIASSRLAKAKEEAEAEAAGIKKRGEASRKSFETSLTKHKSAAAARVASMLMGESK